MGNVPAPESPVTLTLKIGAETRDDLVRSLNRFANEVARHQVTRGCWGGAGSNGSYELVEIEKTPEQYQKELADWATQEKQDD